MRRKLRWNAGISILVGILIAGVAGGAWYPNSVVRSVVGNAGAPATGSGLMSNGTAAQSTPIGTAAGGGIVLHAGFWGYRGQTVSGVEIPDVPVLHTELQGNFPNPFNPQTRIEFTLAETVQVSLEVFDPKGHLVCTLVDEQLAAGPHHANWDGTDLQGRRAASGLYFFRLRAGEYESVMKMTLVK